MKVEVDSILQVLSGTQPTFLLCLQPHSMAGLSELLRRNPALSLDQKLLRDQVCQVLAWVKLIKRLQLRGQQMLDYLRLIRETERVRRLLASKEEARAELRTLLGSNLLVAAPNNQPELLLGRDLLHGLQVGVLAVLTNLDLRDLLDQALNTFSNISHLPASLSGTLSLENGRSLLSQLWYGWIVFWCCPVVIDVSDGEQFKVMLIDLLVYSIFIQHYSHKEKYRKRNR